MFGNGLTYRSHSICRDAFVSAGQTDTKSAVGAAVNRLAMAIEVLICFVIHYTLRCKWKFSRFAVGQPLSVAEAANCTLCSWLFIYPKTNRRLVQLAGFQT